MRGVVTWWWYPLLLGLLLGLGVEIWLLGGQHEPLQSHHTARLRAQRPKDFAVVSERGLRGGVVRVAAGGGGERR